MEIKWIISDLDGTIMDHTDNGRRVCPTTIKNLNTAAKSNKYHITIATGRHYLDAYDFIKTQGIKLPKHSYVIGSNGAQVYDCDKKELVYKKLLSDKSKELIDTKIKQYFEKNFNDRYIILAYGDNNEMLYLKNPTGTKYKSIVQYVKDYEDVDTNIFKVYDDNNLDTLNHLYKALVVVEGDIDYKKVIKDLNEIDHNIDIMKSLDGSLELVPKGVDKYEAIKYINSNFYKLNDKEIIAFGDSYNDCEMLKHAGISVTRESADPKIRSICSHVIDAPASDFVADGLELLLDLN